MGHTVTLKDLARQLGLSPATVSRALNGYTDIAPETRQRVQQLARRYGYQPNAVARSLVTKSSRSLALIVSGLNPDDAASGFLLDVLAGMNEAAGQLELDLILLSTSSQRQAQVPYERLCRARQVEGVILLGLRLDDPYVREMQSASLPTVVFDLPLEGPHAASVMTDSRRGAYLATRHLLQLGHRELGMINGHAAAYVSQERQLGFRQALEESGLQLDPSRIAEADFHEHGSYLATKALLSRHPSLTALFCASDLMALGAYMAIRESGRRPGRDLAVVGFDDVHFARHIDPPLTTVRQDRGAMGRLAVALVHDMMAGQPGHTRMFAPQLVVRESSCAPP